MTPQDLAALHARSFQVPRPWRAEEFSALLSSPNVTLLGDSRAVALFRVAGPETELLTLATDPPHRRQGLAQGLVEAWLTQAARRGAEEAFLEVAANNAPAIALYRAAGLAVAGSRRNYYRDRQGAAVDAVVMRKDFQAP